MKISNENLILASNFIKFEVYKFILTQKYTEDVKGRTASSFWKNSLKRETKNQMNLTQQRYDKHLLKRN